jgi:hypothetical protein
VATHYDTYSNTNAGTATKNKNTSRRERQQIKALCLESVFFILALDPHKGQHRHERKDEKRWKSKPVTNFGAV